MTLARTATPSVVKTILKTHSNANTKYLESRHLTEEITKSLSKITVILEEHKFINSLSLVSLSFTHLQHVYLFEDFKSEYQTVKTVFSTIVESRFLESSVH